MDLKVIAIGVPDSNSNILFFALEALGLTAATMAHHELFTKAAAFDQNIALDTKLDETSEPYRVLSKVESNQYLPGFVFYSRAGASLLEQLKFKKIIIVRDPRDIIVGNILENIELGSHSSLKEYYQNLTSDFERIKASILGFIADQTKFPGVALESIYRRLRYFTLWCNEPSTLVIRYEDLIDEGKTGHNLVQQSTLSQISEWLGLKQSQEQINESAKRLAERFQQQPGLIRTGIWRDYFTPELIPLYKQYVGRLLQKFHYEDTPEWVPPAIKTPVVAITVPKAGTHLLDKTLRQLALQTTITIPMELHARLNAAEPLAQSLLEGVQPGEYILTHLFYNWNVKQLLDQLKFKIILVIRDPHDVVVSYIRYVQSADPHEAKHFLALLDDDAKLFDAIVGVPYIGLNSASESLNRVLQWLKESDCLLIRFEDLIGTKGQGSKQRQISTIQKICQFLELDINYEEISSVADKVFDTNALTFREGQIGTWQRYFKPEHHNALNKLLDDNIEQFGYTKYLIDTNSSAACDYSVLAISAPGAGLYLLDIVLDEIGLGREFIISQFPYSYSVEADKAVPLNLLSMYHNSYEAAQTLLGSIKRNKYALSYMPFSENGLQIVERTGLKRLVMLRNPSDAAKTLSRSLPRGNYPISAYFRSLPDNRFKFMAVINGISSTQSGSEQAFLLSNSEIFQHLAKWSRVPDTLVVHYEDLVGEIGGGSKARQFMSLTTICNYLGIRWTAQFLELISRNLERRFSPLMIEDNIG